MAKKSKKKSPTRRRRRAVGALALNAKSPLLMYGSMALGYFMGDKLNAILPASVQTMDQKLVGGVEAGLGAALVFAKLGKKQKGAIEVGIGGVLIGAGAKKLLREFGIITGIGGYQTVPVIGANIRKGINGYQKVPVIGYTPNRTALNGVPSMNSGYTTRPTSVMGCVGDEGASGYNPHN